ncbi:hypothetical protein BDV93DRAFT_515847 [Ceratobasidium sp. AG-I]|nr:hypothetical protein BDV93DRAFT_515847 [Ceratobasidium sp. AG-I]
MKSRDIPTKYCGSDQEAADQAGENSAASAREPDATDGTAVITLTLARLPVMSKANTQSHQSASLDTVIHSIFTQMSGWMNTRVKPSKEFSKTTGGESELMSESKKEQLRLALRQGRAGKDEGSHGKRKREADPPILEGQVPVGETGGNQGRTEDVEDGGLVTTKDQAGSPVAEAAGISVTPARKRGKHTNST